MKAIHITRIIVKGFKGFKTTDIVKADITMVKKLQQLISTNGSGKSTFLSELNISPINKGLFYEDGYKEVYFTVDGVNYVAISSHTSHVLKDLTNKVTLTQGTTISGYNDTIKQKFDYDHYIWKLATGQVRFTSLDRAERQKWIETISGLDFDYAFKIYKSIKTTITGVKRTIKEYESELSNSGNSILSGEDAEVYLKRREVLSETIEAIIATKGPSLGKDVLKRHIDDYIAIDTALLKAKTKLLASDELCFDYLHVDSIEEFRARYNEKENMLDSLDMQFKYKMAELEDKSKLRAKFTDIDGFNINEAESYLAKLTKRYDELVTLVGDKHSYDHETLRRYIERVDAIKEELSLALIDIASDGMGATVYPYTATLYKERKQALHEATVKLSSVKLNINHIKSHIEEINRSDDITCPECNSVFKDGGNTLLSLNTSLNQQEEELGLISVVVTRLEETITEYKQVESNLVKVKELLNKFIPFYEVKELIDSVDGTSDISSISDNAMSYLDNLKYISELQSITIKLTKVTNEIDKYKSIVALGNPEEYQLQCDAIELELIGIRDKRLALVDKLAVMRKEGSKLAKYITSLDELDTLIEKHTAKQKELRELLFSDGLNKMLGDLQIELGKISSILDNDRITRAIKDKLQTLAKTNKVKLTTLLELEKAINPTTGIIAEQLTSYCQLFSSYVTRTLATVWGYSLTVLPPVTNDVKGVSYRFPMVINDGDTVDDISFGSTSQKSIIDLAILLTSRKLLNMDNQLLILDEVGVGFDTVHNQALGEFLYELVSNSPSKNIMLIHHDTTIRQSLGDFDTIVFDPTQVIVDEGYNEYVKLSYK